MPMQETSGKILIVDDEESICETLAIMLKRAGYAVVTTTDSEAALSLLADERPDVILLDVRMPNVDGLQILKAIRDKSINVTPMIMTAFSAWDTAVEAMRLGAFDYIRKPFDRDDVKACIQRAMHFRRLSETLRKRGDDSPFLYSVLVGNSQGVKELFEMIRRVAPTDATVLIQGESGTGKELVARAVHYGSARAEEPFITVNCGAFTETLLESELFGHVQGAFTGAVRDKKGLIEVADGGTFFLDEVSEMSPQLQVKILRVLEEREYKPVGGTQTRKSDVRFITATNRNLEALVKTGAFREDLFYRLNVICLDVPPLRERKEDIPLLAGHFIAKYAKAMNKGIKTVADDAMDALMNYEWPGNVRELENAIQRAVALSQSNKIVSDDLLGKVRMFVPAQGIDLEKKIEDIEKAYLTSALAMTNNNLTKAAALLGMNFRQLRYKLKKYGLGKHEQTEDDREDEPT
jgi:two-component system response regulator PilR (NtrC family)